MEFLHSQLVQDHSGPAYLSSCLLGLFPLPVLPSGLSFHSWKVTWIPPQDFTPAVPSPEMFFSHPHPLLILQMPGSQERFPRPHSTPSCFSFYTLTSALRATEIPYNHKYLLHPEIKDVHWLDMSKPNIMDMTPPGRAGSYEQGSPAMAFPCCFFTMPPPKHSL